jgi:hypothetical protein
MKRSKGIDHFEERELIEIGVAGANSPDAVFTHKNGGVRVVEQNSKITSSATSACRSVGRSWDASCRYRRHQLVAVEVARRRY